MLDTFLTPVWISLRTVIIATIINFFLGIFVARCMSRYLGKLKSLIEGIFILPMVLPPTVVGLGLLLTFSKNSPIGKLLSLIGATLVFSWPATVIAAVVVAFPLMYITAQGAFEQVDMNIEDAARTLGASEWKVFWSITMPMAWPGVAAGTVLTFARSLGEFGATLMVAGNIPGKTATIPIAIYFAVQSGETSKAVILIMITLAIAFISIAALAYWKRKRPKIISFSSNRKVF
ncbi:MAG: molybdate ABC transporter permease subunit [Candidatus Humimicrobiaceae bacterium]